MKRVLLVAYGFPPRAGSGVQRALKLARYLGDAQWRPAVLTVSDPPSAHVDETLLSELPADVDIVRAWSLEPTRLVQALKRMGGRGGQPSSGSGYSGRSRGFIRFVQSFFIPDEKRLWALWAVPAGRRYVREQGIDAIVSTGPPHTAHVVASRIAGSTGIPHIVDLRDPWVGNHFFVPPTPLHAWLQRRLERRVFGRAAAIVTTTPTVTADVASRYPGLVDTKTITNGYDPADLPAAPRRSDDRFVLTYAGTFSGPRQPDTFLAALALAERQRDGLAERTEVHFVGAGPEADRAAIDAGVRSSTVALGFRPRAEALAQLAGSDVALLIMSAGHESRQAIPGKLFEYLGLGLSVLALAGPGDVDDLLAGIEGAHVVPPDDPAAVADALVALYDAWRDGSLASPTAEDATAYSRIEIARSYGMLLDEVTSDA